MPVGFVNKKSKRVMKMKKIMMIGVLTAALASTSLAYDGNGGIGGLIHGCCFGARGAAAYNDGKNTPILHWVDRLLLGNIIAGIEGAMGKTTADYRAEFGDGCF